MIDAVVIFQVEPELFNQGDVLGPMDFPERCHHGFIAHALVQ